MTLRRVVLFGSTLPGRKYRAGSDIDVAVEGGNRARLERIAATVPQSVDVVLMDLSEIYPQLPPSDESASRNRTA